ncbi:hypothetical protein SNOG_03395 [Parastagonospora nodorum SN15]|uniref:Uncharacterized protein n=1 Tax=Phaeosphaeria nodorum (strain SN15 / ATCC MYA-4574 / FGSC 10173) TaxID=321614 RepID=Q0UXW9_PHANO|nr:hypothetical protein SNOG_03395 [Parastagonospora nodorum SN15]EAT88600.1 hypothetical protein SNOG_03395 [Parastagonospora nodorum SN15]
MFVSRSKPEGEPYSGYPKSKLYLGARGRLRISGWWGVVGVDEKV